MKIRALAYAALLLVLFAGLFVLRVPAQDRGAKPAAPPTPEDRFARVRMRAVALAPGVTMLLGAGGNIGVCTGPDGVVLIDDQFAPLTPRIRAAVDSISGGKPVRFVLNTHWHGDHTGGNANFADAGAVIIAQDNVRQRMSATQFRAAFHDTIPASPANALPIVTFTDSLSFHLNGDDLRVFHVKNAHTDGDVIVRFERANVIHMGDTFFNGGFPVIDVSTGGTIGGMIAADDLILGMAGPQTRLIPGHGPLGDRDSLKAFRDMLVQVRDKIGALVKQGKTLEETVAAHPLADLNDRWGIRMVKPDTFVGVVYADLARGREKK